jgi:tellurite methyltransferase
VRSRCQGSLAILSSISRFQESLPTLSQFDRDKWNQRYSAPETSEINPPTELFSVAESLLPTNGRALDVAGGNGRNSWPLLARGLQVTLADISPIALELAASAATEQGFSLATQEIDFELEPFPAGPWDVIVQVCFLNRALFAEFPRALAPGGLLLIAQPTVRNLERHPKPPRPFLLEEQEILNLVAGLEIVHYTECWQPRGRHEAQLIARRS